MGKLYEDWNKLFCDKLVEEIKAFEEHPSKEQLCVVKDLIEVTNGLQEMEMDGAIRRIAEDRYGYDSSTGRFRTMPGSDGNDMAFEFMEMFNAGRGGNGRGGRRRRDSRGRYMAMMPDYPPNVFYPPDPDEYPWEYGGRYYNDGRKDRMREDDENMDEVMNARGRGGNGRNGGRGGSTGRAGNRGGMRNDGREYSGNISGSNGGQYGTVNGQDDGMYMLRQQDGMPIMTPYNAHDPHDIPKKMTEQQYKEWMDRLANDDGTDGAHWSKQQVEVEAKRNGVDYSKEGIDTLWACTNLMYSDFCSVGEKFGVNKPSFYIHLAHAFLNDEDFDGDGKEKLSIYYHTIVDKQ